VQFEGLGQLKNLMISLEIEPVTCQLVACLNELCYHVPPKYAVCQVFKHPICVILAASVV
jgi:hypothetical protein